LRLHRHSQSSRSSAASAAQEGRLGESGGDDAATATATAATAEDDRHARTPDTTELEGRPIYLAASRLDTSLPRRRT
ncbi:hypothetical protein THAOC_21211, partial [Thalassiosira oceanica]